MAGTSRLQTFPSPALRWLVQGWVWLGMSLAVNCGGANLPYFPPTTQDHRVGDWNQSGGGHSGRSFRPHGIEPPLRLLWEQRLNNPPLGSSLISGPSLLQMTKTSTLYSFDLGGRAHGKRGFGETPCAPPAITGLASEVLVVAEFFPDPLIKGVSRLDGSTLWSRKSTVCVPTVSRGDTIVVIDEAGTVTALTAIDGEVVWELHGEERYTSGPSVFGEFVIIGDTAGALRALGVRDGEEHWLSQLGAGLRSRPAVSSRGVFAGTGEGEIVALSTDTGDELWRASLGGLPTPGLTLSRDLVVAGCVDRLVYALDVDTGDIVWRFETGGVVRSTPVSTESVVYCGSGDGFVYALELSSGSLLWKYRLDGPSVEALALGPRTLVVTTENGSIYVFGRG